MTLVVQTYTPQTIPASVAEQLALTLTRQGSEMNQLFQSVAEFRIPVDSDGTFIAIAYDYGEIPIGWASLSAWNGITALQCFVHPIRRRRGLALALSSILVAAHQIHKDAIAVFHQHCMSIGLRLGFGRVERWKRTDDGWIKSEERHGAGQELSGPSGVHASP